MSINTSLLWFLPAELWFVWPLQPPQAYSYTKHMDFVAKSWKPQRGQNWLFNKCCPNKNCLAPTGVQLWAAQAGLFLINYGKPRQGDQRKQCQKITWQRQGKKEERQGKGGDMRQKISISKISTRASEWILLHPTVTCWGPEHGRSRELRKSLIN